ncbi:MAG: epoxyqueuosine reductase QueH [Candidatus Omnitrophica bacterium]|nr:epoxyqueuosine reductase QueH [Candidatus Omnitrophota bacterium]
MIPKKYTKFYYPGVASCSCHPEGVEQPKDLNEILRFAQNDTEPSFHKFPILTAPNNEKKVLLHCCCAVCAGDLIESMLNSGIEVTIYYYNPNIFPKGEYDKRKSESKRFAEKNKIPFIDPEYESELWEKNISGLECEPERGKRCEVCFSLRLEKAAEYASSHGFKVFTTSLSISRFKDINQIKKCADEAAQKFPGIIFWDYNWRKKGGQERMEKISKRENFYRQNYCGCKHSIRNS